MKSRLTLLILLPQWPLELSHSVVLKALTKFFFFFGSLSCGILVPQPGVKPILPTLEVQTLNPWTAREGHNLDGFHPSLFSGFLEFMTGVSQFNVNAPHN